MSDNKRKVTQIEKEISTRSEGGKEWVVVDQIDDTYTLRGSPTPLTEEEYQALLQKPGTGTILVRRVEKATQEE